MDPSSPPISPSLPTASSPIPTPSATPSSPPPAASSPYTASPSHSPTMSTHSPHSPSMLRDSRDRDRDRDRDRERSDAASRTQYTHEQIARELLVVDTEFLRSLSPLEFVGLEWNRSKKDLLARNVNG